MQMTTLTNQFGKKRLMLTHKLRNQRISKGGYGSSSLKECIELLNTANSIAPAPLDSGVGKSTGPPQKHGGTTICVTCILYKLSSGNAFFCGPCVLLFEMHAAWLS